MTMNPTTSAATAPAGAEPIEQIQAVVDQRGLPAMACRVLGFAGIHHLPVRILSTGGLGVFSESTYDKLGESPTFMHRCCELLQAGLHIRLVLWGDETTVITPVVKQLLHRYGRSMDSNHRLECRLIDNTMNRDQVAPFIAVGKPRSGPTALLIEESERQCDEVADRKALAQILSGVDDLFTKQVEYFDSIWDQLDVRRQVRVPPEPHRRPREQTLAPGAI